MYRLINGGNNNKYTINSRNNLGFDSAAAMNHVPAPPRGGRMKAAYPSTRRAERGPGAKSQMNVVIVESAAKAKTINKYLGSGYKVIASYGHVRDLPAKDGSVEPDQDFAMYWEVDPKSQKIMREIADALKDSRQIDPRDRP